MNFEEPEIPPILRKRELNQLKQQLRANYGERLEELQSKLAKARRANSILNYKLNIAMNALRKIAREEEEPHRAKEALEKIDEEG